MIGQEILEKYRTVKDQITELDRKKKDLQGELNEIEDDAMRWMEDQGLETLKIDGIGTLTMKQVPYCTTGEGNWADIMAWAIANNQVGIITHSRFSGTRAEEFMADGGVLPEFVGLDYRPTFSFRRS